MNFTELVRRTREHIGQEHRYRHSLMVARCAATLARLHGADPAKARVAGLLHDLARLYSPERLIAECELLGMPIAEYERAHPVLLHARLGSAIARDEFGVDDPEVLSAIEKHTTGAGEMSPLDCAVYLADSLEPGRTFPERGALWELAKADLGAAMRALLELALEHNVRKGRPPSPPTLAAARAFGLPEVAASAS